jgi:DNA-binding transcriptional ArsR family regulator
MSDRGAPLPHRLILARLRNCANILNQGAMEERAYRQSRLCRVLGNPLAYSIVKLLAETREITPSRIARGVGRSVSRVSHVLAALRTMEVVRYETNGNQASYRLKHPRETRQLLASLERFVDSASPAG